MQLNPSLVEDLEVEAPPTPEPEKRKMFRVGDICVLKDDTDIGIGTIPKHTTVEITKVLAFKRSYDVRTMVSPTCNLILNLESVHDDQLEDYEDFSPSVER